MATHATAIRAVTGRNCEAEDSATGKDARKGMWRRRVAERRQEIRPLRVLIASESKFQHEMFRRLFKPSGGQTVHVYTSDQTLDALETMSFALAVIDDCSRGIDGSWTLDVYHWCSVMAGKAGVPIMLLTSNAELAQQLNREHSDVLAIEPSAAKIIRALDSMGFSGKR